ncbi:unnamed protein product, partial [Candidula unifasciata]
HVVNDAYSRLLYIAGPTPPTQVFCTYLNISICNNTETLSGFEVTLYNPIGRVVESIARLPVSGSSYVVYAEDGATVVPSDVHPISQDTFRIPTPEARTATNELVFSATLPPVGFVTYF